MSLIQSYKTLKRYRKDPLVFISQLKNENGHLAHLKIFGKELFVISSPEDVIHVLKENNSSYTKGRTTKALRQFLGRGLITNEGESWRRQHRLIRPLMNLKSVYETSPKILETSLKFIATLKQSEDVNIFDEMNRLTWQIILKSLFSQEPSIKTDDWLKDILELMHIITGKTRSSFALPFWVPTKNHRRLKMIIQKFDDYVYEMIKARRAGHPQNDLLQLLIDAKEDDQSFMTDREIRDEIMTFMMAGHETITNSMTWTLIELSKNKKYLPELQKEARLFFKNQEFEFLNTLPWLGAVIDESLRLWPPVWVFMREAQVEDRLGSLVVPKKANVVLATFNSHRSEDLWERASEFLPERFLPENKKKIIPGSYYPFGLGPRACIGAYFAGMEARIILASLIHHIDWDIINLKEQDYDAGISLRPTSNIFMTIKRRS